MKLYELLLMNDSWDGMTILNIHLDSITLNLHCIDLAEKNISILGKSLMCYEVDFFNNFSVTLKGLDE